MRDYLKELEELSSKINVDSIEKLSVEELEKLSSELKDGPKELQKIDTVFAADSSVSYSKKSEFYNKAQEYIDKVNKLKPQVEKKLKEKKSKNVVSPEEQKRKDRIAEINKKMGVIINSISTLRLSLESKDPIEAAQLNVIIEGLEKELKPLRDELNALLTWKEEKNTRTAELINKRDEILDTINEVNNKPTQRNTKDIESIRDSIRGDIEETQSRNEELETMDFVQNEGRNTTTPQVSENEVVYEKNSLGALRDAGKLPKLSDADLVSIANSVGGKIRSASEEIKPEVLSIILPRMLQDTRIINAKNNEYFINDYNSKILDSDETIALPQDKEMVDNMYAGDYDVHFRLNAFGQDRPSIKKGLAHAYDMGAMHYNNKILKEYGKLDKNAFKLSTKPGLIRAIINSRMKRINEQICRLKKKKAFFESKEFKVIHSEVKKYRKNRKNRMLAYQVSQNIERQRETIRQEVPMEAPVNNETVEEQNNNVEMFVDGKALDPSMVTSNDALKELENSAELSNKEEPLVMGFENPGRLGRGAA